MDKIYKFFPRYAFLPVMISVVLNMIVYFGTRLFTAGSYHYDLSIPLDDWLPFVPVFMIPYVLAYVTWVIGLFVIGRESKQLCYEVLTAEQIAKLICLIFFILVPTQMNRPEVTGSGLGVWLTKFIYCMDTPDNLFPSIHCLINWIVFRASFRCSKVGTGYRIGMFVAAILVFVSVLLTKQHLIMDIFGGIAAVEIGLFLSKKWKVYHIYYKIERRMMKYEKC